MKSERDGLRATPREWAVVIGMLAVTALVLWLTLSDPYLERSYERRRALLSNHWALIAGAGVALALGSWALYAVSACLASSRRRRRRAHAARQRARRRG